MADQSGARRSARLRMGGAALAAASLLGSGLSLVSGPASAAVAAPTVRVEFTLAPNTFGSPSWPAGGPTPEGTNWQSNAVRAMLLDADTEGAAGPTQFVSDADGIFRSEDAIVTGFPSWLGQANPAAPYHQELGNRLTGVSSIKAPAGETIDIANGVTRVFDDQGNDELDFAPGVVNSYATNRIGVIYNNGVGGDSDDTYVTSGTGAVNEIILLTPGNSYEAQDTDAPNGCTGSGVPAGCDSQENRQARLDDVKAYVQERGDWVNVVSVTYGTTTGPESSGSSSATMANPELSLSGPATVNEGDTATYTVTASQTSQVPMTVAYSAGGGTATSGDDYATTSGTATIAVGQTETTFTVAGAGDSAVEGDETFDVTLTDPTASTLGTPASASTTISDDDDGSPTVRVEFTAAPNVFGSPSFGSPSPTGSNWSSNAVRGMLLDEDSRGTTGQPTLFATGTDFLAEDIVVTGFPSWKGVADPAAPYASELGTRLHAINSIKAAPGKTIDIAHGVTRSWVDDGTGGDLSFGDTTSSGYDANRFIGVRYGVDGQPGTDDDVYLTSGTGAVNEIIGFSPGNAYEPDACAGCTNQERIDDTLEYIQERGPWTNTVTLTYAKSSADPAVGTGSADIDTPQLSIAGPVASAEGGDRTYIVTASEASLIPMTVDYATAAGSAAEGDDFTGTSGSLTFAPGETSKTFTVQTAGDDVDEPDETFTVSLSNAAAATILTGSATTTLQDDDANPVASLGPDKQVAEGTGSGTTVVSFTITLDHPASTNRRVGYFTADGSATQPADYTKTQGSVVFTPGQTSKTVSVPVKRDALDEVNEAFTFGLLPAPFSTTGIGDDAATGTIVDDDGAPSISLRDATVAEGNSGTRNLAFGVRLNKASGKTITVRFTTADGSARAPGDYVAQSGTVTFAPGETAKTVNIVVKGDRVKEANETMFLSLFQATNAGIGDPNGSGVVRNDD